MARCGCSGTTCSCLIQGDGTTATVAGAGTAASPWIVSAIASTPTIHGGNTATADDTVTGTGTALNPFVVTTDVNISTAAGNILTSDATGLLVLDTDITTTVAPQPATATFTPSVTGGPAYLVGGNVNISAAAGNTLVANADGLFVPDVDTASTLIHVTDTPTVDASITGDGSVATPFDISAAVKISSTAGNILTSDATGLLVLDTDTSYTASNGVKLVGTDIQACLSTDAGNDISFGTDGCLFVPTPAASTPVTVTDTSSVNLTLTGQNIKADVIIDPVAGNILVSGPAGLSVIDTDVATTVAPLDTPTVNTTVTGGPAYVVSSDVIVSPDAGNQLVANANGLFVPADVDTVYTASKGVKLVGNDFEACFSTDAGNVATLGTDGCIFVPPPGAAAATVINGGTTSTAVDTVTGAGTVVSPYVVTTAVKVSTTAGNTLTTDGTGLFVPADVDDTFANTNSVHFTTTGTVVTADVQIDPVAGNQLVLGAAGLSVIDTDVTPTVAPAAATSTFTPTVTGGPAYLVGGNVKISATAGNQVVANADGLFVAPDTETPLTTGCGLTGAGTVASPLVASVQAWPGFAGGCPESVANAGGVYCDATSGALISDPPVRKFSQEDLQLGTSFPAVVIPNDGVRRVFGTANITLNNPSPCYDMDVMIVTEWDANVAIVPGAQVDFAIDDTSPSGAFGGGDSYWRFENHDALTDNLGWQMTRTEVITIPAGTIGFAYQTDLLLSSSFAAGSNITRNQVRIHTLGVAAQ